MNAFEAIATSLVGQDNFTQVKVVGVDLTFEAKRVSKLPPCMDSLTNADIYAFEAGGKRPTGVRLEIQQSTHNW